MDLNKFKELEKRLEELAKIKLSVGVPSSKNPNRGNGINQAGLAAVHEFGTLHTPERSFLRSTFNDNNHYEKELASQIKKVARGELDPKQALEMIGIKAVGDVQLKIASGIGPALSEKTIKKKGSSVPLIDTGELRQSITYEVK